MLFTGFTTQHNSKSRREIKNSLFGYSSSFLIPLQLLFFSFSVGAAKSVLVSLFFLVAFSVLTFFFFTFSSRIHTNIFSFLKFAILLHSPKNAHYLKQQKRNGIFGLLPTQTKLLQFYSLFFYSLVRVFFFLYLFTNFIYTVCFFFFF